MPRATGRPTRSCATLPRVQVLRRPPGRLAPELWRDGLDATDAPLVAFSTAQMVPASGWLSALLDRLDETGAAVVGGPIEPASGLSAADRALYLLRYVNYLRPLPESGAVEPPGDNALYRRDRLRGLDAVWEDGFWEVEVHRRLRARGERLAMANEAAVEFRRGQSAWPRRSASVAAMRVITSSTRPRGPDGGSSSGWRVRRPPPFPP